jgi:hypothetical protein
MGSIGLDCGEPARPPMSVADSSPDRYPRTPLTVRYGATQTPPFAERWSTSYALDSFVTDSFDL